MLCTQYYQALPVVPRFHIQQCFAPLALHLLGTNTSQVVVHHYRPRPVILCGQYYRAPPGITGDALPEVQTRYYRAEPGTTDRKELPGEAGGAV